MIQYNFPGVSWPGDISAEVIYSQIRAELASYRITSDSRLLIKYEGDSYVIFDAEGSFDLAISYLVNKCKYVPKRKQVLYHEVDMDIDDECSDIDFLSVPSSIRFSAVSVQRNGCIACEKGVETADDTFDEAMDTAADEVRLAIKQLLLQGFLHLSFGHG